MPGELPFIKLWVADFIADTHHWTAEEVGHYFRLLLHQWKHGEVPPDPIRRELISVGLSGSWSTIESKFPIGQDGRLQNRRLERERETAVMEKLKRQKQTEVARRARHPGSVTGSVTENVTEAVTTSPLIVHSSEYRKETKKKKLPVASTQVESHQKSARKRTKPAEVEEVFETYLRCREIHFVEENGKRPRGLDLTPKRRALIATAIRAHGFDKTKAAGVGIFLSAFHLGENDRKKSYLSPEIAWRMNGKIDNVEVFSELAEDELRPPPKEVTA